MTKTLTIIKNKAPIEPVIYDGYRVLHKVEGGWQNTPIGMPEVMPPINAISVAMTEEIQQMSYALMKARNALITAALWTRIHDGDRAFTNFNGFDMEGDPRANFITGSGVDANGNAIYPLPKYDKCQRVCGGSFVRGIETVTNNVPVLRCVAGVHGIDADKPMPSTQEILDNVWYIYAVSMDTLTQISHFPQGQGGPVLIPFLIRGAVEYPLIHFERWQSNELPDPLRIYNG